MPSSPTEVTPDYVDALFMRRMRAHAGAAMAGLRGTAVFDAGIASWTLHFSPTDVDVHRGAIRRPTTKLTSDIETLAAVIEGRESGAQAFYDGRLTLRGRIGYALALDGAFVPADDRPDAWPSCGRVSALGVDTTYLEAGPRDAQPILLLHGVGATNASFMPLLLDLARDHHVIAPDLPGFGMSSAPPWHYEPADFSHWVNAFLRRMDLGGERVVVIGNSLGGRIAMETGLRYPELVDRLVLLCPSAAFRRLRQLVPAVRLIPPNLGRLPLPLNHGIVVRAIHGMFADPRRLPESWYDAGADEFEGVMHSADHRYAFFAALRQVYLEEAFGAKGFWDRLPSLGPPALFLWGRQDRLVPYGFAKHVQTCLPGAPSIVLEDCGHVPQFEHPELTNRLVREFLDTGDVRAESGAAPGFPADMPTGPEAT